MPPTRDKKLLEALQIVYNNKSSWNSARSRKSSAWRKLSSDQALIQDFEQNTKPRSLSLFRGPNSEAAQTCCGAGEKTAAPRMKPLSVFWRPFHTNYFPLTANAREEAFAGFSFHVSCVFQIFFCLGLWYLQLFIQLGIFHLFGATNTSRKTFQSTPTAPCRFAGVCRASTPLVLFFLFWCTHNKSNLCHCCLWAFLRTRGVHVLCPVWKGPEGTTPPQWSPTLVPKYLNTQHCHT